MSEKATPRPPKKEAARPIRAVGDDPFANLGDLAWLGIAPAEDVTPTENSAPPETRLSVEPHPPAPGAEPALQLEDEPLPHSNERLTLDQIIAEANLAAGREEFRSGRHAPYLRTTERPSPLSAAPPAPPTPAAAPPAESALLEWLLQGEPTPTGSPAPTEAPAAAAKTPLAPDQIIADMERWLPPKKQP